MTRLYKVGWRGPQMTNSAPGETRTKPDRTGKRNGNSREWQRIFILEDVMALLLDVEEARITIKRAAWETGQAEIYQASERQRAALERLRALLSEKWYQLSGELGNNGGGELDG